MFSTKPKEEIKPDLLPSKDRLKLDLLSEKVEEQVIRVGHGVVGGGHGILEKDPTQILVNGVKVLPAAAKVPIVLPKLPPQGWSQRFKKLPSGGTGGV